MVQRRAVNRADKELQPENLPTLYKTLIPLTAERHAGYFLSQERSYEYAADTNAIPITADEFPQAMRNYPIVLAGSDAPTPVALVGFSAGKNDYVQKDGSWAKDAYVPAYLRRYPFAYVREAKDVERNILCADLSSMIFSTHGEEDRALFKDGKPSQVLTNVMDFSNRYEMALQRTRAAMEEAKTLDLIDASSVTITRNGKTLKVEGFHIISEEKLRKLPDDVLAGLARRGILNLFAAHHLSLTNFTSFGEM
ncbi:SapC protein [Litoreibacter meonggei]|uniref:SapC protein n=1 Tax=Litoreibacter meonggei TaxID=1049199 RepID=A0A497WRV2_9RHOB|nr:SapC family protein [Litoreibacter meonggei]RLJ59551.1 SapC protein [Litoreibacter meonggei]